MLLANGGRKVVAKALEEGVLVFDFAEPIVAVDRQQ